MARSSREVTREPRSEGADEQIAPRAAPHTGRRPLTGALEAVDDILRRCDSGQVVAVYALEQLLGAHMRLRNARRLQTATRTARFPPVKTLAGFDFGFQPSIKREQLETLRTLGYIERRKSWCSSAHLTSGKRIPP